MNTFGAPHPRPATLECVGGPWDGERIAWAGEKVTVTRVDHCRPEDPNAVVRGIYRHEFHGSRKIAGGQLAPAHVYVWERTPLALPPGPSDHDEEC